MTHGHFNCLSNRGVLCAGRFLQPKLAWPHLLDKYLRSALLGCNIQVIDVTTPAHMITSVFHTINRIATPTADLVIEDYTVNDQRGKKVFRGRINDSLTMRNQVGAHEYLAQRLRAQRTALIMMEAYPNFHHPLVCQADLEHSHAVIAEAHAVPVLLEALPERDEGLDVATCTHRHYH